MTKDQTIEVETVPAQAVAVRENASELMKRTTDVAGVCRDGRSLQHCAELL